MKKSTTKRALLMSMLSLLLCFTMFVGTTFAWFTDEVSSGKNTIVAGNLDVELDYWNGTDWATVEGKTDLLNPDALWEPGHTEVVYLKLSNVGTLELKYQFLLSIFNEIEGLNNDGEAIRLSKYLRYGVVDMTEDIAANSGAMFSSRSAAIAAVQTPCELANFDKIGTLAAKSDDVNVIDETYCALVVWMPTDVGNEANHDGYHVPKIELGLTLAAAQASYETDSFDEKYDENAKYSDLPIASVTKLAEMPTVNDVVNGNAVVLDTAYLFQITEDYDDAQQSEYAKWNADFVVSFDKDVAANSIVLGGQYESYSKDWLAFSNNGINVPVGDSIRLLKYANVSMNYEELCNLVKAFSCGVANLSAANVGTTMTVELRIYETEDPSASNGNSTNVETGEYEVIGKYTHTFESLGDIRVPESQVTASFDVYDILNSGVGNTRMDDVTFTCYTFDADNFTAQYPVDGQYKDWLCDYYVSTDAAIDTGVVLVGQYDAFGSDWLGFHAPASTTAYAPTPLLGAVSHGNISNWTYEDICNNVKVFKCGIINTNSVNKDTTVVVELRMVDPADHTNYIVVSSIKAVLGVTTLTNP